MHKQIQMTTLWGPTVYEHISQYTLWGIKFQYRAYFRLFGASRDFAIWSPRGCLELERGPLQLT